MKIARTIADLRRIVAPLGRNRPLGLVPTMGAFHRGHESLFHAARAECAVVVTSLFVNPTQFGDPTDLASYPRNERNDEDVATAAGVDVLFAPSTDVMYPAGYATWVDVNGSARGLEGEFRPGHFRGVATVCLKLFNIVRPEVAFFGQKDAQQVAVIKQMVRDLDVEIDIRVLPTIRDADGLALSSRNVRLSADDRRRALAIPRALAAGLDAHRHGRDAASAARVALGELAVDYVEVADFDGRPTLAVAARVGGTRLIDNVPLDQAPGHGEGAARS